MKKVIIIVVALTFVIFATSAFATIANTRHNLTTGGGFTRTTDATASLCGFCHLPHGGNTSIASLPLWARSMPALTFTPYGAGSTLTGTPVGQPGTYSLTCLSCHDGSIGLGTIVKNGVTSSFAMTTTLPGGLTAGGAFQATNIDPTNGYSPYVGKDLQNDHPVGFQFPVAGYGVNGGVPGISLTVNNTGVAGLSDLTGNVSGASYPVFQYTGVVDAFECATCHDPHLEATGTTQTKFLRAANATICQDCHNTK